MSFYDKIVSLSKQFYPSGRAFKMPSQGTLENLHLALAESENQAYSDAVSILDSILPDNANFTTDDCTDWERRLGLITNPLTTTSARKAAIIQKLNQPGLNPAKGHYLYLQEQLQLAGFNVYVYENKFPVYGGGYTTRTPFAVSGVNQTTTLQHGNFNHGLFSHGLAFTNKIANYINDSKDLYFGLGGTYKCTFFIGGSPLGSFANIPTSRHDEFRQLVLKTKQIQDIALTFINYI